LSTCGNVTSSIKPSKKYSGFEMSHCAQFLEHTDHIDVFVNS